MSAQISNLPKGAHQAVTSLMEAAERIEADAPTGEEASLRRRAREQFTALGLPTRRLEAWRYTDLAGALQGPLPPLASAQDARLDETVDEALRLLEESTEQVCAHAGSELSARIVFVDGRFSARHSKLEKLPKSIRFQAGSVPLGNEDVGNDVLGSLNLSLANDGFELVVEPDAVEEKFVNLVFLSAKEDPCSMHSRAKVHLGGCASLKLLETHMRVNDAPSLQTHLTDVVLGRCATLEYACIEDNGPQHVSLARMNARLEHKAQFHCVVLGTGGKLVRQEYNILLEGSRANAQFGALSLAGAGETRDINVMLHHKVPECFSNTLVKNVLTGDAHGVFQGLVRVDPGAAQSDGRQTSKALLLGRDASMNAKPELEVFNDDVECAHGSAIGELDRDALFYLRARGISENDARQLLTKAFLIDVLERIEDEVLQIEAESHAVRWLENVLAQTQEP